MTLRKSKHHFQSRSFISPSARWSGSMSVLYSSSRWGGPGGWAAAWRSKEFHSGLQNKNRILHNVRRVMVQGIRVMQAEPGVKGFDCFQSSLYFVQMLHKFWLQQTNKASRLRYKMYPGFLRKCRKMHMFEQSKAVGHSRPKLVEPLEVRYKGVPTCSRIVRRPVMVSKTRTLPAVSTVFIKAMEMDMKAVKSAEAPACMRKTEENAKWAWIKSCCYFKAQTVGRWPPGWECYAAQIASHVFADCGASRGAPPCMPEAPGWHPPFSHGWSKIPVKFLRCSCFQPHCWPDCVSDHCFVKSSAVPFRWGHWCWQQKPRSALRPAHASTISRRHLKNLIFCSFPGPLGKHFSFFPVFGTFSEKEALPSSDRCWTRCPKALRGTASVFWIQMALPAAPRMLWHAWGFPPTSLPELSPGKGPIPPPILERAECMLCELDLPSLPPKWISSRDNQNKTKCFTMVELAGRAADGKN